tara:strand:+ start:1199 stop:1609 length:411 start_codon:yes stop_codon:yes gene_type:complete
MARLVPKIYPTDINENIPIGIAFPLNMGTQKQNYTTTTQVHDNLRNLILTIKGERVNLPTFGSDLYLLLFEQMYQDTLAASARIAIKDAVKEWMPFVTIHIVEVTPDSDNNKITIQVDYSVQGWPASNTLNLTVNV